jgi:hypothetical protein
VQWPGKEIVDYMMGIGLEPTLQGFDFQKSMGPSLEDSGWKGRLARAAYESLTSTPEQQEKQNSRHGKTPLQKGIILSPSTFRNLPAFVPVQDILISPL